MTAHLKPAFLVQPIERRLAASVVSNRFIDVRMCKGGIQFREVGQEWGALLPWNTVLRLDEERGRVLQWESQPTTKAK